MDESVPHCVPKPHRDFLYTYVKYEIPNHKILDVTSLSGSVAYDPLKKTLRARCGSEEANIGTLYLATSIGNSKITLKEVQDKKLYAEVITSLQNPQNVAIYYEKLCENLDKQPGNPEWSGFYPLAFSEGCCDGYNPETNTCNDIKNDKPSKSHNITLRENYQNREYSDVISDIDIISQAEIIEEEIIKVDKPVNDKSINNKSNPVII